MSLRDDIRRQRVFNEGNPVAQIELSLFQALHLDNVVTGGRLQRLNRGIEIAMLLLQLRELRLEFRLFLFCHRRRITSGGLILKVFLRRLNGMFTAKSNCRVAQSMLDDSGWAPCHTLVASEQVTQEISAYVQPIASY